MTTTKEDLPELYTTQEDLYKYMQHTLDKLKTEKDTGSAKSALVNLAYLVGQAQINLEFIEEAKRN